MRRAIILRSRGGLGDIVDCEEASTSRILRRQGGSEESMRVNKGIILCSDSRKSRRGYTTMEVLKEKRHKKGIAYVKRQAKGRKDFVDGKRRKH